MNTRSLLTQTAICLLVCAQSALFAQNGAIQLTLKGGWASPSDPVRKVQVVNPYAYLMIGDTGLQVLDVSSPTNAVPLGRYDAAHRLNGFHVDGHHAYLATGDSITDTNDPGVLEILDVSQPTNLVFLSQTETSKRANTVCVTGDFAYVAESTWWSESNRLGAVEIFNVTNPALPTVVGRYDASGPVNDIKVVDGHAYLAGGDAALVILGVSDGHNPQWIGEFRTNGVAGRNVHGYAVEVNDRYAYLSVGEVGFFILDVRDPSRPVRTSEVLPGNVDGAEITYMVRVTDRHAFVAIRVTESSGVPYFVAMIVYDISNPTSWIGLGVFDRPASLVDFQLVGGHAYMAVTGGLLVYEFTELPYFKSISKSAEKIVLTWDILPGLKLQCTSSLTTPDWRDVPDSLGTNRIELPREGDAGFFRLVQPETR